MARTPASGAAAPESGPATPSGSNHRARLLEGMAAAVREKGFRRTTIADVVAHAGVSRRTFYEHFSDPVDCYLALIDATGTAMLTGVAKAMADEGPLGERIDRAVGVYLDLFAADPDLSRSYWTELHLTGDRGLELTRRKSEETGRLLSELASAARASDPSLLPLSVDGAILLAAGIRELALLAHDAGRPLDTARATSVEMIRRAVGLATG